MSRFILVCLLSFVGFASVGCNNAPAPVNPTMDGPRDLTLKPMGAGEGSSTETVQSSPVSVP
jgi:hypothetical protein